MKEQILNKPEHAMRWLEKLVPGAELYFHDRVSSYYNDPAQCYNYVVRERKKNLETIKKLQKEIKTLKKQNAAKSDDHK